MIRLAEVELIRLLIGHGATGHPGVSRVGGHPHVGRDVVGRGLDLGVDRRLVADRLVLGRVAVHGRLLRGELLVWRRLLGSGGVHHGCGGGILLVVELLRVVGGEIADHRLLLSGHPLRHGRVVAGRRGHRLVRVLLGRVIPLLGDHLLAAVGRVHHLAATLQLSI